MTITARWRAGAASALAAAALALSACIVSPGTFASTLDLRRDGTFTFTYDGEIYLLAMSKLTDMANEAGSAGDQFIEQPCYGEEDFEERACTEAEIAEQREVWEQQAAAKKKEAEREAEAMRAMLGGIDPADPNAANELVERLRRQQGWNQVDYKGEGLFDVRFSLTSRIGHDFTFPTFERFPMSNAFVVANLRQGDIVRIDAPGFAVQGGGNPIQGMVTGMAGMFDAVTEAESEGPRMPELAGTFRIVTDGRILANNTDEGPKADPAGEALEWTISRRTQSPPTALIQLGD